MAFVSQAQRAKCYSLKSKGKAGSWDCKKWELKTRGKKLPYKLRSQLRVRG